MTFRGARYIHILVPCPLGWGAPSHATIQLSRLAKETGVFPVFEAEYGEVTSSSKIRKVLPVEDYLRPQKRFAHLFGKTPAVDTIARLQALADGIASQYQALYPSVTGNADMTPVINEAKGKGADTFVAYSYPPDTMLINEQARTLGLAPKVLFTGVGTQFPMFKGKFGAAAEGVMAPGGIDAGNPQMQAYLKRFKEVTGQESDRFASPIVYTSLQMLQQAIERVGKIDRAAVTQELKSGSFETVLGSVKLEGQMLTKLWHVGQWQNGEFNAIAPTTRAGVKPALIPRVTP